MRGEDARAFILRRVDRAQLDYAELYLRLYIAYNAWYRQVTRTDVDREALTRLKGRFVIWDDFYNGRTMSGLLPLIARIVAATTARPLETNRRHWNGSVRAVTDWQGVIEFWYQIRCDLFHGSIVRDDLRQQTLIRLAYESLNLFMTEITARMRRCFTPEDLIRLQEVHAALEGRGSDGPAELVQRQRILQRKYIHSPDVWNVDMVRV